MPDESGEIYANTKIFSHTGSNYFSNEILTHNHTGSFASNYRGRIIKTNAVEKTTKTLGGIKSIEETPIDLMSDFLIRSGKLFFDPDNQKNNNFYQWLSENKMPFVAGLSGSTPYYLGNILAIMFPEIESNKFNHEDFKSFSMLLFAAFSIFGHHSFAEIAKAFNDLNWREVLLGSQWIINDFKIIDNSDLSSHLLFYNQVACLTDYGYEDEYDNFIKKNNLNQYSALTWETLRGRLFKYELGDTYPHDLSIRNIVQMSKDKNKNTGEVNEEHLKKLIKLLNSYKYKCKNSHCNNEILFVKEITSVLNDNGININIHRTFNRSMSAPTNVMKNHLYTQKTPTIKV